MKKPLNEISNSAFYARFNGWFETSSAIGLHLSNKRNISSVSKNLRFLQRGLTGNRGLIASSYMDEWSILQPYLLYYWPISFYEVSAILYELKTRAVLPDINSVLDLGSGPGPASFAAQTFGAMRASLVDKSKRALAMASAIAAKGRRKNLNLEIIEYCASIEDFCAPKGESYDLIIAANSLNELWADSPDGILRRRDLVLRFLPNLQPEGILIIVEPSAHYTSIPLLELRDSLLAADLNGFSLACLGPCPHSFACPMLDQVKKPCFSEWQWNLPPSVRELADCAGLDRDLSRVVTACGLSFAFGVDRGWHGLERYCRLDRGDGRSIAGRHWRYHPRFADAGTGWRTHAGSDRRPGNVADDGLACLHADGDRLPGLRPDDQYLVSGAGAGGAEPLARVYAAVA